MLVFGIGAVLLQTFYCAVVGLDYEIEAVVGHSAELPCNVTAETGDSRLNVLAWYINGSSTAFYSRDWRYEEDGHGELTTAASQEGRYELIANDEEGLSYLRIRNVRPADAGLYYCRADFVSSPELKTNIRLNVIQPPQTLWVIHENGTRVGTATAGANASENIGPYFVGDKVHLFCVAFGGRPLANLTWWAEHRQLKNTWTLLSELRVRSDLEHGPLQREDHGLVLSCTAGNSVEIPPLAVDVVIDMHLPPELVSIRDMTASNDGSVSAGRVHAGQTLRLQCRVLGARPTPTIQWRLDNDILDLTQNVIREPSQRLVISEAELRIVESYDESQITCCTPANHRGPEAFICAQAMPLTVQYQPVLELKTDGDVVNGTIAAIKGSNLQFNCSYRANPSIFQMMWFHEDDVITQEGDEESGMRPILELTNLTETDSGEYVCAASNEEGSAYSEPLVLDVIYPAYCKDDTIAEYGLGENESINITCNVNSNPPPQQYRWVLVNEAISDNAFEETRPHTATQTIENVLQYQRPNGTPFNTIFCWGLNGVTADDLPHGPCTFLVTDETAPRPPRDCRAVKGAGDITVECVAGHDGGLPQKFRFSVQEIGTDTELLSITSRELKFIIQEPKAENIKFVIVALNEKGESSLVNIYKDSIINETKEDLTPKNAVTNITTLALALCGGVLLIALAACGLVLCAHERGSRSDLPHAGADPPLCAYTDESNCETFHDSDDSEFNIRRTDSFRRAMSKYPSSKNYDVRRTSSFHSARYAEVPEPEAPKCGDTLRHAGCRVHSLQNINRRREMEAACDHLIMHLPPEPSYHLSKPLNTFYTMPRKTKNKSIKHISDDASEITQTSDGFSLPPPPDEYGTYRAATRIKDIPIKSIPSYTTIKKSPKQPPKQSNDVTSPNTIGVPTISGSHVYSYPDEDHHQGALTGIISIFRSFPK